MTPYDLKKLAKYIKNKKYEKIYKLLTKSYVDINDAKLYYNAAHTPLATAIREANPEVVAAFLAMGANPNVPGRSWTRPFNIGQQMMFFPLALALHTAEEFPEKINECVNIIEHLLRYGAKAMEGSGVELALHQAAAFGNLEIVTLLIRYGFNPHKKDQAGETPENIARRLDHQQVASFLEKPIPTTLFDTVQELVLLAGKRKNKIINRAPMKHIMSFLPAPTLFERRRNACAIKLTENGIQAPEIIQKILSFSDIYNRGTHESLAAPDMAKHPTKTSDRGIIAAVGANSFRRLDQALSEGYVFDDDHVITPEGFDLDQQKNQRDANIATLNKKGIHIQGILEKIFSFVGPYTSHGFKGLDDLPPLALAAKQNNMPMFQRLLDMGGQNLAWNAQCMGHILDGPEAEAGRALNAKKIEKTATFRQALGLAPKEYDPDQLEEHEEALDQHPAQGR
jgi:hypothetical protein